MAGWKGSVMCNFYAVTKGQQAIRDLTRAMLDRAGNLPPLPGIFPDYAAPIVRNHPQGAGSWSWHAGACHRPPSR